MGQILSQSEVEAIFNGLDLASATEITSVSGTVPQKITLYDFEHPEPLQQSQLDSLSLAAVAGTQTLKTSLSRVLQTSFDVKFLGVEQSTYRDYLATAEVPGCISQFEASDSPHPWLVDISRSLAFAIIDCLLGGRPFQTDAAAFGARPYTDVESRLIDRAIQTIIPDLAGNFTLHSTVHMTNLVSDGSTISVATSNAAVALVSFEVTFGMHRGLLQLCLPWQQVARPISLRLGDARTSTLDIQSSVVKVPLVATANVAKMKITAKDLANLNAGDLLLSDISATDEIYFVVDGHTIFQGNPGQSDHRKVIRLTAPVECNCSRLVNGIE